MSYELRNRPRSPWSLCGSKVEHRSVDPEGLRFDSSWGLGMFSLSQTRDKTKKHFSLFLYRAQNVLSLLFYYKNCMVDSKENDKFDQDIKGLKHCHMIIEWPLGQGNGKSGPRTADFARIYISCARLNWFVLTLCHQVIPFKGYGTFNTRKRESYCTQFSQTHKGWPPPRLPQTKYNYSFFESTNNIFINLRQKVIWNR